LEKASDSEPIALISEGTRVVEDDRRINYSEEEVKKHAYDLVSGTNRIVFATHYSRDIDRLRTFYQVAKKSCRKLVISPKTAYLLHGLLNDERLNLPDPIKDEDILVYYRKKRSGTFDEADYHAWEREFMDKMVNYEFVAKNQRRLIMTLDFQNLTELVDIRPSPGSHFVYSMSEPFSEEDLEFEVMHNWLNHFKIEFHQLHSSGHLNREQISSFINDINPKKVFPIHTENQLLFKKFSKKVQMIQYGKTYKL